MTPKAYPWTCINQSCNGYAVLRGLPFYYNQAVRTEKGEGVFVGISCGFCGQLIVPAFKGPVKA